MKVLVFAAFLAVARAGVINTYASTPLAYAAHAVHTYAAPAAYSVPIAKTVAPVAYAAPFVKAVAKTVVQEEFDPNPQYSYGYDVQDGLTGDSKSQTETRNGDVVQGSYSLNDPDGTRRTVDYTADPIHGFNAVVHKEPLAVVAKVAAAPAPLTYSAPIAKVVAPLTYNAPVVTKVAAPFAYSASIAQVAAPLTYSAPIAKVAAPLTYAAPIAKIATPVTYYH